MFDRMPDATGRRNSLFTKMRLEQRAAGRPATRDDATVRAIVKVKEPIREEQRRWNAIQAQGSLALQWEEIRRGRQGPLAPCCAPTPWPTGLPMSLPARCMGGSGWNAG